MNENIKILWNLIEEGFEEMCPLEAQAIKNLTTNYQEQEVFIGKLLKENEELRNNSVPVAKIKEKIEDAVKKRDFYLKTDREHILIPLYNERINILNELLEGK